ncbi:peptidoglycan/xylan/chitin deacetylase (PgdA/CDA1 family) [Fontibacillus phaseoli]|uniref:Peptidoglycan/xylan/chitin deacetylase (PgdA/CDA1 family) n=1 Tax=Fontibacillus phaseoli TaxID=1416533 RepID=A0A369BLP8_9BACL|nr:polysaccharide deacetylase family protein [Fontibacillus phaseoli]RCX22483.1 peptidoglycan/xylan/chitin deacetylase (PgdA/CDA1 family) [Fontibacillus phaseoli]
METLLLWLFYISSLYAFIPGLITRIFGFRVFRRGARDDTFALTFDDGPDSVYTPQLLDLLKRYDAKATFFVVGSNAEKHPDLLKRMHEEGHLIGIHNYVHKTNWFMGPAAVKKQIQKTSKIIQEVTGDKTNYYRPPWGIVNLFDFAKRDDTQIVLWSAMFSDWRERLGADRLTNRMMKKLRGGEVFLLHDCGSTLGANSGAPGEMLVALERVLKEAEKRKLRSIRVDEMIATSESARQRGTRMSSDEKVTPAVPQPLSWTKRCVVSLWLLWEKIFHLVFQLQSANKEDPFLYFRIRPYHGDPVEMIGGIKLCNGDRIMELHFDNKKLFEIGTRSKSSMQLAIKMVRNMEKELPKLAKHVVDHRELHDVKALYGVSMINRGPEKFGFTVTDLQKGWFAKSSQWYLKFLLRVIHPDGNSRVKQSAEQLIPKLIVMPIDYLVKQYLTDGSHRKMAAKQENEEIEEEAVLSTTIPCS